MLGLAASAAILVLPAQVQLSRRLQWCVLLLILFKASLAMFCTKAVPFCEIAVM